MSYFILGSAVDMTSNIKFKFTLGIKPTESAKTPVLIVGNVKYLESLKYDDIKIKLPSVVTSEVCFKVF